MTDTLSLSQLIKSGRFVVPDFQRDYSWERQHVEDFWDDACDEIDRGNENYYFGPIVLIKKGKSNVFKIVDGQQRITTLSILLSLFRDICHHTNNGTGEQWVDNYINDDEFDEPIPRLQLNKNNNDFYCKFILKIDDPEYKLKMKPDNQYDKKIFQTYKFLHEKIKNRYLPDDNKKTKKLFSSEDSEISTDIRKFIKKILYHFHIFHITIDNEDEASKLFATLNQRGLKLSISDLIKNYIFSVSTQKYRDNNNKIWEKMIATLGEKIKPDKYLQHHYIAWKKNVKEQDLYSTITGQIKNDSEVIDYLTSISEHCNTYSDMMSDNSKQNVGKDLMELFLTLKNDSAQPFILNAIKKWGKTSEEVKEISKICLDIHFRAKTIGTRSAKEIVDVFAEAAESIRGSPPLIKNVKEIVDGKETTVKKEILVDISYIRKIFHQIDITDKEFMNSIEHHDFSNRTTAKYFLKKMEESKLFQKDPDKFVNPDITLEHIMPQNEDAKGWEHTKTQHGELLNKIGNLTLLYFTPNSELRDDPFEKKKIAYGNSNINITEKLKKKSDWNETEIIARSKIFASDAIAIWHYVNSN